MYLAKLRFLFHLSPLPRTFSLQTRTKYHPSFYSHTANLHPTLSLLSNTPTSLSQTTLFSHLTPTLPHLNLLLSAS